MSETTAKLIGIIVGIILILAAIFDWDFFFDSMKKKITIGILGRTGARIFYGVLGALFIILILFR